MEWARGRKVATEGCGKGQKHLVCVHERQRERKEKREKREKREERESDRKREKKTERDVCGEREIDRKEKEMGEIRKADDTRGREDRHTLT